MNLTALLPMKGHSERVPNKNMRRFAGAPLVHAVASRLEGCRLIDSIVIDTDSKDIANYVLSNFKKARIIERPESLRGDMVPMNDIIGHDIGQCAGEHFVQTHSTNPLLRLETLESAINEYFASLGTYDSIFSVTKYQSRFYDSSGRPINHNPDELLRTQDLPPIYEENSNFFIFSRTSFINSGNKRIGQRPRMFPMERIEAVDIDEEADFNLAETLYLSRGKCDL